MPYKKRQRFLLNSAHPAQARGLLPANLIERWLSLWITDRIVASLGLGAGNVIFVRAYCQQRLENARALSALFHWLLWLSLNRLSFVSNVLPNLIDRSLLSFVINERVCLALTLAPM